MTDETITLVTATVALLDAAMEADPARLEQLLGAAIAAGWVGFPEALPRLRTMQAQSDTPDWATVLFLLTEPRTLIGMGGYKGPPSPEGAVEIGYAIAPTCQNRGLATRAAGALVARAFADPRVESVRAHTLPEENASVRVLRKLGFACVEPVPTDNVWTFRLDRARFSNAQNVTSSM